MFFGFPLTWTSSIQIRPTTMRNLQWMVTGRMGLRTCTSVPSPSRLKHVPPNARPKFWPAIIAVAAAEGRGRPPFIRRCLATANEMAPPLKMKSVYLLVQINEYMIFRSFVIGAIWPSRGEQTLLACGAVCLWKWHMNVIAMEGYVRGGCGELRKSRWKS